jgi:hypothetical protein
MPGYYKWPAYVGNALLALIGLIVATRNSSIVGLSLTGLAGLNFYLVRKLDLFSREEAWLALEIKKAKMREELLLLERKLAEEEGEVPPGDSISNPETKH